MTYEVIMKISFNTYKPYANARLQNNNQANKQQNPTFKSGYGA